MDDVSLPLPDRLNLQTAPISWPELERFFARGRVLDVAAELDLIEVAAALTEDDVEKFSQWTQTKQVQHLQDETAKQWVADDRNLWAVVIAPWVLVQNRLPSH
ncbi:MAG: DUF2288 domain-containing protein [Thiolinea sp.]